MAKKKKAATQKETLFKETLVPAKPGSERLFEVSYDDSQPVECLGKKFPNDEARREYFSNNLREKLKDPEFRKIEGFPIGEDEDILALSDPPFYTACPNPFLADFIELFKPKDKRAQDYSRLPYPAALEDSRNNKFVNAHSYATKVPHESVMRLVLHYTEPGDIVLDGFVGTGMTAVGVQFCSDKNAVIQLGYTVKEKTGQVSDANGNVISKLGSRRAIVSDICPAATHLSYNFNFPYDVNAFESEVDEMVSAVLGDCGWMYETRHGKNKTGTIICVLWSDVFLCNNCNAEIVFWEAGVDLENSKVNDVVSCSKCQASSRKSKLSRALTSEFDTALNEHWQRAKQVPVTVVYEVAGKRMEKLPDANDLEVIRQIDDKRIDYWFPSDRMPEGDESRRNDPLGLTNVHHFFTKRNLYALSCAWSHARSPRARFMLTSLMYKSSKLCAPLMSNYFASRKGKSRGGWVGKERSGTLYCPSIQSEVSVLSQIASRRRGVQITAASSQLPMVGVSSVTQLGVPENSIDYIFTDPPFGGNKMYSELAFIWESWLRVFTNNECEAITSKAQGKKLADYEELMTRAFVEYFRVLKPGRWITVEFSNTAASVWNALQNSISKAGFVVADVRDLHKQQGSILGYTTTTATRQDLAISAYKPQSDLENKIRSNPKSEQSVWQFVSSHLRHLQIVDVHDQQITVIAERQGYVLFDRLVAFHVQRGLPVPISSAEFHAGLRQRFPERDGMYFLPEQVGDYEKHRLGVNSCEQLSLFVSDEKSAIQWVRQRLTENPMKYQTLQPLYMKEAQRVWEKHEQPLELQAILDQNFAQDSNGNWQIPDSKNEAHLEQLRNRHLLKEFHEYNESKGKLKIVRTEALRAGFKDCWQRKDFATIVQMAKRLPDAVIQEDQALLMYFDNASLMLGE